MSRNATLQPPSTLSTGATSEQIAARAHEIWIQEGRPEGRDVENWLKAEGQIREEREASSRSARRTERDTRMSGSRGGL